MKRLWAVLGLTAAALALASVAFAARTDGINEMGPTTLTVHLTITPAPNGPLGVLVHVTGGLNAPSFTFVLSNGNERTLRIVPGSYTVSIAETIAGTLSPYVTTFTPSSTVLAGPGKDTRVDIALALPGTTATVTHSGPDRYGYCSVAGNTDASGKPLAPGTFLNLYMAQPDTDKHYTGATPGYWVQGAGATCTLSPQQAAIAAASTTKVNHVGATGDPNQPEFYTYIPSA